MVIVEGNRYDDPSSNLDEAVCISHSANTHEEGMNLTILSPLTGK